MFNLILFSNSFDQIGGKLGYLVCHYLSRHTKTSKHVLELKINN
jgi:hypothetical protein